MHVVLYIFCVLRYFLMGAACFSQGSNLNEKKALGKHGDVNIAFVGVVGERAKSVKTKQSKRKKKLKAPPLKHAPTHQEQESLSTSENTEEVLNSTRSNTEVEFASSTVAIPAPNAVNPLHPPDVAKLLTLPEPTLVTLTQPEVGLLNSRSMSQVMSKDSKDFSVSVGRTEDQLSSERDAASAVNYLALFQNMIQGEKLEVTPQSKSFSSTRRSTKTKELRIFERVTIWSKDVPMTLPAVPDHNSDDYDVPSKDEVDDDHSELEDFRRSSM